MATVLRVPAHLVAHTAWSPADRSGPGPDSIVYLTERRRRATGWLPVPFLVLVVVGVLAQWAVVLWLALAFSAACVVALAVQLGGRSGFYRIAPDGGLGEFLGKRPPATSGLRRQRVGRSS